MSEVSLSSGKPKGEIVETDKSEIKLDESKLNEEQKKMLADFRAKNARKVDKETVQGWFSEIADMDDEKFPAYMEKLINEDHDYYSMISAAVCLSLAVTKVFNKHHIFRDKNQGLKIANGIYASMTGINDDPFRVFEFYTLLDPSCDGQIVSIPPQIFAVVRTKAAKLLAEQPDAPAELRKRWKQVSNGKLPAPWVVRDMD
jgi:hypothetical protein